MKTIRYAIVEGIATLTLNRPKQRNAFDEEMLCELHGFFAGLDADVRAVVLTGEGSAFCAGADLKWMAQSRNLGQDANIKDATQMANLFRVMNDTPRLVIGRVNGAAMGGALGLLACCDVVIARKDVSFSFSEVRLGLVPAVISPFVLNKITISQARRYFLTGESFDPQQAREMGLVHEVVEAHLLDETIEKVCHHVRRAGPQALAHAKALVTKIGGGISDEAVAHTVDLIAHLRVSPEAQEGFAAFLGKRPPGWLV
jgi:methylglutaconyl-CoA hydratase